MTRFLLMYNMQKYFNPCIACSCSCNCDAFKIVDLQMILFHLISKLTFYLTLIKVLVV